MAFVPGETADRRFRHRRRCSYRPAGRGTLPAAVSLPLRVVLASHTHGQAVWLAVWQGYGWDYENFVPDTMFIKTDQREWDLFRGPLDLINLSFFEGMGQTANMVWPDDRSWCLATGIDLNTTYIGGPARLIETCWPRTIWKSGRPNRTTTLPTRRIPSTPADAD